MQIARNDDFNQLILPASFKFSYINRGSIFNKIQNNSASIIKY